MLGPAVHDGQCSFCSTKGTDLMWLGCCRQCGEKNLDGITQSVAALTRSADARGLLVVVLSSTAARAEFDGKFPELGDKGWAEVGCGVVLATTDGTMRSVSLLTKQTILSLCFQNKKRKRTTPSSSDEPQRQSNRERATVSYSTMDKNDVPGMVSSLKRTTKAPAKK